MFLGIPLPFPLPFIQYTPSKLAFSEAPTCLPFSLLPPLFSIPCDIRGHLTFRAHSPLLSLCVSGVRGQEQRPAYLPVSRPVDLELVCDAEGLLRKTREDVATLDLETLSIP